ncbi:MAG: phospholipase [Muribaculaceae bacterium]|nr:phospholipase [Muribaculaceae bacterium]
MIPAMYIFALMVVVGIVLYIFDLRSRKPGEEPEPVVMPENDGCTDDCCSTNEVCPSEMLLAGCDREIVYFEDEELDAYKGRAADDYTPDEEEQFRDVLYTLKPTDLLTWEQSVKKRGIILPKAIREEFIMLYGERAQKQ